MVSRLVRADTWFTLPAVAFQPLSGLARIGIGRWQWDAPWILGGLGLYFLAGACRLPVLWLQLRMRDPAVEAAARDTLLPARYRRLQRWWEGLGYPAFNAMVGAFFLMVVKPG